jgi:hypothetical protein
LPGEDEGYMHIDRDWWEGYKKYAVEMDSGAPDIYAKFHKDWFRHSEVNVEPGIYGHRDKQTAWRSHKPTFTFF